jgi:hypothetical protein
MPDSSAVGLIASKTDALRALADRLDLLTEAIQSVPFSFDTIIYWVRRCAPKLTGKRYFRAHWIWYGALA